MILSNRVKRRIATIALYAVLILITGLVVLPLVIIVSSSFKNESEIFDFPFRLIPKDVVWNNFLQLKDNFPLYTWNSIKLTVIIVIVQLITASTGAYAFTKLQWKFRDSVFMLYLVSMMIPSQAVVIPQFLLISNLGLYDSHAALVFLGAFTAIGTFLFRQFFLSIPNTYMEAARIDGAREWGIFLTIMLPMSKAVIATQTIFSFRYFWNDFFNPMIYITSPALKTIPLGMTDFVRDQYTYWGPQLAAGLLSIIPVLLVFLAGQRYFIEGTAASGIKG